MSYELEGVLYKVFDEVKVSDKFKKKEFVVKTSETYNDKTFTQYIKLQFTQDKTDRVYKDNVGCKVKVSFNLNGREWTKDGKTNYFNSLDAWRLEVIEQVSSLESTASKVADAIDADKDDLPF